jgi:hypothetical protein
MEPNPYASPMTGDIATDRFRAGKVKLRRVVLLALYLLVGANAVLQACLPVGPLLHIVLAIMVASTATYACIVDSRIVGRPIVQSIHWIMFLTWPLAAPIYLIYSRGLRGVLLTVLHGIGLVFVSTVAFHLAGYLAYGNSWFRGGAL